MGAGTAPTHFSTEDTSSCLSEKFLDVEQGIPKSDKADDHPDGIQDNRLPVFVLECVNENAERSRDIECEVGEIVRGQPSEHIATVSEQDGENAVPADELSVEGCVEHVVVSFLEPVNPAMVANR